MKYLRGFNENSTERLKNLPHSGEKIHSDKISIFDQDWFEKLLPDEIKIVSQSGYCTLKKNDCSILQDEIQFNYWQKANGKDGDVLEDGEPSILEFDIHFVKNVDGIKLLVDITYGDQMVSEFSIETPNKINVIHYNGVNSKFDQETHFGFCDESINDLVKFFNSFTHGIKLEPSDLAFIDEHLDSYQHDINNKDHYYTDDSKLMKWGNSMKESAFNGIILVMNNSKPPQNKYLPDVISYLKFRGIPYQVASTAEELQEINTSQNIIGAISTGSDYRVNANENLELSKRAFSVLKCPIIAFCFGFQAMAKFYGSEIMVGRLTDEVTTLEYYDQSHPLFRGIDLYNQPVTFCFHDYPKEVPNGFKLLAQLNGKVAGISSGNKFGLLFHPEEIEETFPILDNFINICKSSMRQIQTFERFRC